MSFFFFILSLSVFLSVPLSLLFGQHKRYATLSIINIDEIHTIRSIEKLLTAGPDVSTHIQGKKLT